MSHEDLCHYTVPVYHLSCLSLSIHLPCLLSPSVTPKIHPIPSVLPSGDREPSGHIRPPPSVLFRPSRSRHSRWPRRPSLVGWAVRGWWCRSRSPVRWRWRAVPEGVAPCLLETGACAWPNPIRPLHIEPLLASGSGTPSSSLAPVFGEGCPDHPYRWTSLGS